MAKNNKKEQAEARRVAQINAQPTIYTFNFKDVPAEKYTEALELIFREPDFCDMVAKRNNLVNTAGRIRQNSAEMMSLIKAIQQRDRKLADLLFATLVQINVRSDSTYEFFSFDTLLKYYVDYSQDGMKEKVGRLAANLDKVTFLSDMLESVLTDVKADMREVFNGVMEFQQFDGVQKMMQQLRGFFQSARSKGDNTPEAELYFQYADSINDYLDKRLKTYSEKHARFKPILPIHTAEQMVDGINQFFDSGKHFGMNFIKRTENGGAYIDAVALAFNLSQSQTDKLDRALNTAKVKVDASKDALKYCFRVTDVIMGNYKE